MKPLPPMELLIVPTYVKSLSIFLSCIRVITPYLKFKLFLARVVNILGEHRESAFITFCFYHKNDMISGFKDLNAGSNVDRESAIRGKA